MVIVGVTVQVVETMGIEITVQVMETMGIEITVQVMEFAGNVREVETLSKVELLSRSNV
jgi:tRNA U34 5-carboxymethylaminomethyl modifying GTPase MnmE/TrmE